MSYTPTFFDSIAQSSIDSAEVIVPRMMELVRPMSVVDVGCGRGWFLRKFMELGVDDVFGFDGGPPEHLAIPEARYAQVDLTAPITSDSRFDLAVCLEVAEHLPDSAAAGLVDQLCTLAPVVLFSAAIPMQSGEGHINERWPDYWIPLFKQHGFTGSGWPRVELWDDERVAVWYRQNLLLFVSDAVDDQPLRDYISTTPPFSLFRLVHPELFGMKLGVSFR